MAASDLYAQVTDQAVGGAAGRRDGPRRICRGDRCGVLFQRRRTGEWCGKGGGKERVSVV